MSDESTLHSYPQNAFRIHWQHSVPRSHLARSRIKLDFALQVLHWMDEQQIQPDQESWQVHLIQFHDHRFTFMITLVCEMAASSIESKQLVTN